MTATVDGVLINGTPNEISEFLKIYNNKQESESVANPIPWDDCEHDIWKYGSTLPYENPILKKVQDGVKKYLYDQHIQYVYKQHALK